MPAYLWKCKRGHRWEVSVPIAERDVPQTCPMCQGAGERVFTAPALPWTPVAAESGRPNHNERKRY